jgi:hypothetical protein
MAVFDALFVCVRSKKLSIRLVILYGMGSPCGWRVSALGQIHVPIDSHEPLSYVVSGGCPSATRLASASTWSLPRE